ncbi:MAG: Glu/Leu/Phe/Val dehydrogenase [Vicinamibacterales bacterium]
MTLTPQVHEDAIGPTKVVFVREPRVGLEGVVVVDNTACGPAIGGIRLAPDISVGEVARLARAMTFKNAAAGLAHGGAKGGILADPTWPVERRERLIRTFARAIRTLDEYIPGPDMGTDETAMAWIHDEIGRAVGLPRVLGGIPLDEIGATGYGLAVAAEVAAGAIGLELARARVAVQGFGAVGYNVARFLKQRGAMLVAAADSRGAVHAADGLDPERLAAHRRAGQPLSAFEGGTSITHDALVGVPSDIWIPAARPDVLDERNVTRLQAKLVLQGANIPATDGAERWMHGHGILSVPDFVANAGGVICAAVEYHGGSEAQAFATIAERIRQNTAEVLSRSRSRGELPRESATALARQRVEQAMACRRP